MMQALHHLGTIAAVRSLADAAAASPDYIAQLVQWGPAGVVLALILTGVLVPKASVADLRADRDAWRAIADKERESKEVTQEIARVAQNQAGLALESSKTLATVFDKLGHVPISRGGNQA